MKQQPQVAIATIDFLNLRTMTPGLGGLQRWTRDVALLLADRGAKVTVFQKAPEAFQSEIGGRIPVVGIRAPMRAWGNYLFTRKLARRLPPSHPMLFVSQELLLGSHFRNALVVNHGIWWDSDFAPWKLALNRRLQGTMLRRAAKVICVDTNYINWCHATVPRRAQWQQKLRYIPNYADERAFHYQISPAPIQRTRPRILFPRRMLETLTPYWDGRGLMLLLEALALLRRHGTEFLVEFAGTGGARAAIQGYADEHGFGDSIECGQYELDEMPSAYARADVVVIPSAGHEGTSLSAVEALCCGKPVVVTHIGGLPNLVIDGLNGFLCDLNPKSLAAALRRAIGASGDAERSSRVAHDSRSTFGKERWDDAVWSELASTFRFNGAG